MRIGILGSGMMGGKLGIIVGSVASIRNVEVFNEAGDCNAQ
jgi:hypothetical protein